MSKSTKAKNQNINVAVRCRPINNVEKKQGSCSILSCDRIKHEVTIKEKGGIHPFTKTYNFDHVFGPDSFQIDVYKAVVKPVVEEVLTGYNCTIFAYGQTGTGKTFTMEGEKSGNGNLSWEDDPLSGVIPRALHQIFDDLEKQPDVEFSLRVSFMELYNEELFDLLGSSLDPLRLRIYEDNAKKGSVIISGLEEVVVRTKDEVFEILQRGTAKRKTATTLMNDASSRSHSVFSVTIHIKENTIDGEELLKTGKLYLVDLAGSENIGRSGAVDKRAREAGNINQSLLTLGRVITALVEHAPHIPYRESKLTRLLQDSLGGRTKTSIIATISPAACNLEETISTLDYAFRAKNITNRPEVNQKLTKKALLKEYNEEIERLRRDLQASREKNGIYIAQDNYEYIQNKLAMQGDSLQEYEDKIATLTQEMKSLTEMFNDTRETLVATSEKLVTTSVQLDETSKELTSTKLDLKETKQDRDEQKFLVTEHVKNEGSLYTEATELMSTVETTVSDVDGLHDKVQRKKIVEEHNEATLADFREGLTQHVNNMTANVEGLSSKNETFSLKISDTIGKSLDASTKSFDDTHNEMKDMNCFVGEQVDDLSTQIQENQNCFINMADNLDQNIEAMRAKNLSQLNEMNRKMVSKFREIDETGKDHPQIVASLKTAVHEQEKEHAHLHADLVDNFKTIMKDFVQDVNIFLEELVGENNRLKEETEEYSQEMSELEEQVMLLMQKRKESLIRHTNHTQKYMSNKISTMTSVQKKLKSKEIEVPKICDDATEKINKFMEERTRAHKQSLNKIHATYTNVQRGCQDLSLLSTEYVTEAQVNCNDSTGVLREDLNKMLDDRASRVAESQELVQTVASEYAKMSSSACETLKTNQSSMISSLKSQEDLFMNHNSVVSNAIDSQKEQLEVTVEMFTNLFKTELKKDIPTGRTPQRTVFSYPRSLTKTRQHQKLLEQFRASQQKEAAELEAVAELEKNGTESSTLDLMGSMENLSDVGSVTASSVASTSGISVSNSISKDEPKENEPRVKKAPTSKTFRPKTPSSKKFKQPTTTRGKLPLKPSN